jgi:ADP-L-glycero-D-manno-heptose 6-epimerase
MIIITGAAGFIGSNLCGFMNKKGVNDLVLVDAFDNALKNKNLESKTCLSKVHRDDFIDWIDHHQREIGFVMHLGARTNTAEFDKAIFDQLNLGYSKKVWQACSKYRIPLIYASSAATYGSGELGYDDDHRLVYALKPLNPYGESKNDFDKWVLLQQETPPFWAGLKFFNVYGPNEYHKGRMASVIFHAFHQIRQTGKMILFRSHKPEFSNGGQSRDFVHVDDLVKVIYWLSDKTPASGIYNLGTGKARTFLDLTRSTFHAMDLTPVIEFIDTPLDIRDKYQYFTEAQMNKLRSAGYYNDFITLEQGVEDYVRNFLAFNRYA